jgi:hypothetical protein
MSNRDIFLQLGADPTLEVLLDLIARLADRITKLEQQTGRVLPGDMRFVDTPLGLQISRINGGTATITPPI